MLFLNIIYVLLAVAMIALILMQRGAGAQAGSGFGGGASGTVFGARGSANFLSKATKWLAIAFFGISLLMAWQASRPGNPAEAASSSLMSNAPVPAAPAPAGGSVPVAPGAVPTAPAAPAAAPSSVPVAPSAPAADAPSQVPPPAG